MSPATERDLLVELGHGEDLVLQLQLSDTLERVNLSFAGGDPKGNGLQPNHDELTKTRHCEDRRTKTTIRHVLLVAITSTWRKLDARDDEALDGERDRAHHKRLELRGSSRVSDTLNLPKDGNQLVGTSLTLGGNVSLYLKDCVRTAALPALSE